MNSPRIQVLCGVENCMHNQHHTCRAQSLEVNVSGDGEAHSSSGTCCSTFSEE